MDRGFSVGTCSKDTHATLDASQQFSSLGMHFKLTPSCLRLALAEKGHTNDLPRAVALLSKLYRKIHKCIVAGAISYSDSREFAEVYRTFADQIEPTDSRRNASKQRAIRAFANAIENLAKEPRIITITGIDSPANLRVPCTSRQQLLGQMINLVVPTMKTNESMVELRLGEQPCFWIRPDTRIFVSTDTTANDLEAAIQLGLNVAGPKFTTGHLIEYFRHAVAEAKTKLHSISPPISATHLLTKLNESSSAMQRFLDLEAPSLKDCDTLRLDLERINGELIGKGEVERRTGKGGGVGQLITTYLAASEIYRSKDDLNYIDALIQADKVLFLLASILKDGLRVAATVMKWGEHPDSNPAANKAHDSAPIRQHYGDRVSITKSEQRDIFGSAWDEIRRKIQSIYPDIDFSIRAILADATDSKPPLPHQSDAWRAWMKEALTSPDPGDGARILRYILSSQIFEDQNRLNLTYEQKLSMIKQGREQELTEMNRLVEERWIWRNELYWQLEEVELMLRRPNTKG